MYWSMEYVVNKIKCCLVHFVNIEDHVIFEDRVMFVDEYVM